MLYAVKPNQTKPNPVLNGGNRIVYMYKEGFGIK